MRAPTRGETAAALAGAGAVATALWVLHTPPAVHPLWIYKAIAGRLAVGACGAALLCLAAWSWLRQRAVEARRRSLALTGRIGLAAASALVTAAAFEAVLEWRAPSPRELDPAGSDVPPLAEAGAPHRFVSSEWDTEVVIDSSGCATTRSAPAPPARPASSCSGTPTPSATESRRPRPFPPSWRRSAPSAAGRSTSSTPASSYSPTLEFLLLRERWQALDPDVVVLALDMSDFQDDLWFEDLAVYGPHGRLERVRPTPRPGRLQSLYKDLLLVRMFRSALDRLYSHWRSGAELDLPQTHDLLRNRFALTRDDLTAAESEPHWERTLGWMGRIAELTAERGARLLVMTYPYGHQVAVDEWETGRQHYGFAGDKVYPATPGERVERWARDRGLPALNLFPIFRERSDGTFYFPFDGHFTPKAQRLAGEELFRRLVALGWVGPAG
ncbi:MAG: hypothetical protein R2991_16265 [Thermoanaerobaculia bacterium]